MESKQSLVEESLVQKTSERTKQHFSGQFGVIELKIIQLEEVINKLDAKVAQTNDDLRAQENQLKRTANLIEKGTSSAAAASGGAGSGGITRAEGKRIKEELQRMANEVKVV